MWILIYPNNQKTEVDHFLSPVEFKEPQELYGTHCIDSKVVDSSESEVKIQYFKTPHLIQGVELIELSEQTRNYFNTKLEQHKEFVDQSEVVKILNLYCVFDDAIAKLDEKDLIVEEKTAIKPKVLVGSST
jgi:hypothetical protein